ncbi:MAG: ABC transporter permease [Flavobacteriaceae bacterium]
MSFLFDKDTWQEIFGSISKNKLRTGITVIGVMWGIFLLMVLLGAARGMSNGFKNLFGDFATNSVFVWSQRSSMPFKGFQKGRNIQLTTRDVEILEEEYPDIKIIVPRSQTNNLIVRGTQTGSFQICGDYPILNEVQKKELIYGRWLNENDMINETKVTVIEENIYKQLFDKDEMPIGQYITINDISYQVVGVYKSAQNINIDGDAAFIPFSTFQKVYNRGNRINWMVVSGYEGVDIRQLEEDVLLTLRNLHSVNPEDKRAFGSFNLGDEIGKLTGFLTGMEFLTWFVGIATLIAGVIAIGNILLITVKERTKEIGIRRALGATPFEIRRQIILESVFLTTLSGSLGIIVGGFVLMFLDSFAASNPDSPFLNPTVDIPVVLLAVAILIVLGSLIGMIPAHRATIVKPIDALRED